MNINEQFASGDFVVLKNGGPKMRIKWYLGATEVETSWDEGRSEFHGRFNTNELKMYESFDDKGIYIIPVHDFEEL